MGSSLTFAPDGTVTRRDFADVEEQKRLVRLLRDLNNDRRRRDGNDPFNAALSFTPDMWELLKRTNPELHDPDPRRRYLAWRAFAASEVGKAFRVR